MRMIQVINGEIKQYNLSKTGTLKDGRTVSGYHLLDEEILKEEGWLPLEDIQPEYDSETEYIVNDDYEILENKVIKKYMVVDIPKPQEPESTEIDLLNARIQELESTIDMILGGEVIE